MILARPSDIKRVDSYAINDLKIPAIALMGRSGEAVYNVIAGIMPVGRVIIFAGKGNNGGDGYALGCLLLENKYSVKIYDVFSLGQRTKEGKYYLEKYASLGGEICSVGTDEELSLELADADVVVDAIFGVGFVGSIENRILSISGIISKAENVTKIAIDVPLGVNADDGTVSEGALKVDKTVSLAYLKRGLVSYPAAEFVGELILAPIGLPEKADMLVTADCHYIDKALMNRLLPKRPENSNKGSFGKTLLICGSDEYVGAAMLALDSALCSGVGYVNHLISENLKKEYFLRSFPEVIFHTSLSDGRSFDIEKITDLSSVNSSTLIGSGSGVSEEIANLTEALIFTVASPLIIDADAINSIAKYKNARILKNAKRKIILTPHPAEFSRLSGIPVSDIQANRLSVTRSFAKDHGVILVLKGARTVVTDGDMTYINSSGSSALAKAGSGDVLSGLIASTTAYFNDPLEATAFSVYVHGLAADILSDEYSKYGVRPSELPKIISKIFREIEIMRGDSK